MRVVLTVTSAVMLSIAPAAAQSGQPTFPDTHGADADLVCFLVAASTASKATDASQKSALSSEAGFYVSRAATRYPNDAALSAAFRTLHTAFATRAGELAAFAVPCGQPFLQQMKRISAAVAAAEPKP